MSDWVVGRPAPPLRALIDAYVGYRVAGMPPALRGPNDTGLRGPNDTGLRGPNDTGLRGPSDTGLRGPNDMGALHRGLPSRHLTVIVSIGEPIDVVAQTDPRQPPASYRFVVSGLQATSALIASRSSQEGVAIELSPLGSRALLGVPARALWDTSLEAADVVGPPATELWERLHHAGDWAGRFAACDDVLLRLLAATRAAPVGAQVAGAWDLLVASGGTIGVAELCERVGWSRRHLAHRFAEELGLPPKLAGRVVRFERATNLLRSPRRPAIAEVAAACGYYDQPHLNRDFVELAGCPPGEWLETELPSVQDDGMTEPAGSTV